MELKDISKKVFLDRYSLKDENGESLEKNPEAMWSRIAKAVSLVEKGSIRKSGGKSSMK